jgi:hypothetical protein
VVGSSQGDHGARHRGLHASGLVRGAAGGPGAGGAGVVPAPGRARPGRGRAAAAVVPGGAAVPAGGGGVDGVPSRGAGPAHAPPAVRAGAGGGGRARRSTRAPREPRRGRAADPGHGRRRPAPGHPRQRGRRLPGAGAPLDPVGGRAERHRRVRLHRGLLRGAGGPHLRGRDRAVGGPADELAGLAPRPVPVGQLLRRARPVQAGPGGDRARHRAGLLRHPPGAGDRRGVPGDGRAVPRGGPLLPERGTRAAASAWSRPRPARPGCAAPSAASG